MKPTLGILTVHTQGSPPFPEQQFFQCLSETGKQMGIPVIVIHPDSIDFSTKKVKGYYLKGKNQWSKVLVPIPEFFYDRCFYTPGYNTRYRNNIKKLRSLENVKFLGVGLKGKWQLFKIAASHPVLSAYIPPTEIVSTLDHIHSWLNRYSSIILKPVGGSLGIGILKISSKKNAGLLIEGRDRANQSFRQTFISFSAAGRFILDSMGKWRYLIQPYLRLSTKQGVPFDLRVFMQKDGSGKWTTTGRAIRAGLRNSITSNLHGGGKAYAMDHFLKENYPPEIIEKIYGHIATLEQLLPEQLEKNHGPLVELGIDVGIDQMGDVWLIEANSRPGRQIFQQIKDKEALLKSNTNPLYYAKYLMQTRIGG
jgi:hypothetical protein